jgi:hypothetical protein
VPPFVLGAVVVPLLLCVGALCVGALCVVDGAEVVDGVELSPVIDWSVTVDESLLLLPTITRPTIRPMITAAIAATTILVRESTRAA